MSVPADHLDIGAPSTAGRSIAARRNAVAAALSRDYPGLISLLWRHTGNRQLANDLLHDAIVTALQKLDDGAPVEPTIIAGYVFRIALNHLRNHRRRERSQGGSGAAELDTLPAAESASPLSESQRAATARLARRLLLDLESTRDREMLVRFYLDEHDKDQVCAALRINGEQFDRVLGRARARLKKLVERSGFGRWDLLIVLVFCAASGAMVGG